MLQPLNISNFEALERACSEKPYYSALIVLADDSDLLDRVAKCFNFILQHRDSGKLCLSHKDGLIFYDNGSHIRIARHKDCVNVRGQRYNTILTETSLDDMYLSPIIREYDAQWIRQ